MLIDPGTLDLANGIEAILTDSRAAAGPGQIKPELMQSVLEIATDPCPDLATAGEQLADLRHRVCAAAARNGLAVGACGTHPTALCRDQLITDRERYLELAEELTWIARNELIFGTHVHVGVAGADRAIYVADGIRRHLPELLALSANSPFWEGELTGMKSVRTAIFRHFPRSGVPPHYGTWEIYSRRVELMVRSGVIPDYTYLWWDVRPHPSLGTVELRVYDQQKELGRTLALAALAVCLVHRYSGDFDRAEPLVEVPSELIDDSKVCAALRGLGGELVDLSGPRRVPSKALALDLIESLAPDAEALGCEPGLAAAAEIVAAGCGADAQLALYRSGGLDAVLRAAILDV